MNRNLISSIILIAWGRKELDMAGQLNSNNPHCIICQIFKKYTIVDSFCHYILVRETINKRTKACQMVKSAKDFLALKKNGPSVRGRLLFIHDNQEPWIKTTENYSNNDSVTPVAWRPMGLTAMINYHHPRNTEVQRHSFHHLSASPLPNLSLDEQQPCWSCKSL